MHPKKVLSFSKEKKNKQQLDNWSILKEKNKFVFKFSTAIMKLNFLVFTCLLLVGAYLFHDCIAKIIGKSLLSIMYSLKSC
jgi:hypothetical protein